MKNLSEVGIPNVLPPALAPYAKVIYGVVGAIVTSFALLWLGKLGINVDHEIIDAGNESEEITWRQAWNALLPLLLVYFVPNTPTVHVHEDDTSPDDDGTTTLGTPVADIYGDEPNAGPRGEPSQA